jgi:hypothetical protein
MVKSEYMGFSKGVGVIISAALIVCVASGCGRGIEVGPFEYPLDTVTFELDYKNAGVGFYEEGKAAVIVEEVVSLGVLPSQDEIQSLLPEIAPSLARFATISRIELGSAYVNGPPDSFRAIRKISVYYKPDDNPANEKLVASASSSDGFGAEIELTPAGSFDFFEILPEDAGDPNQSVDVRVEAQVDLEDLPAEAITVLIDITLDIYARVSLGH